MSPRDDVKGDPVEHARVAGRGHPSPRHRGPSPERAAEAIGQLPLFGANGPAEARARGADPQTSHQAAKRASEAIRRKQQAVLRALVAAGRAHDEDLIGRYARLAAAQGQLRYPSQADSGIRSRRAELVVMGLVRDSGERARTAAGGATIIWEPTDRGYDAAREADEAP